MPEDNVDGTFPSLTAGSALRLAQDLDKRVATHEAICAERYGQIIQRMGRIEKIMLGVAGALILGLMKLAFFK